MHCWNGGSHPTSNCSSINKQRSRQPANSVSSMSALVASLIGPSATCRPFTHRLHQRGYLAVVGQARGYRHAALAVVRRACAVREAHRAVRHRVAHDRLHPCICAIVRSISIGDRPALEDLVRLCSSARLVPLLDRVFALDDARAVFDYLKNCASHRQDRHAVHVSLYVYLTYHRNVNSIDWQPGALRQLRKIDAHAGKQIRRAVTSAGIACA